MNIEFTEEQKLLQRSVRDFSETIIAPCVQHMEENNEAPHSLINEIGQLGLLGVCIPEEYGGTNLGQVSKMIILEELGRISAAVSFMVQCFHLAIEPIVQVGTDAQKEKYLPKMACGELLGCLALTESTGGSDPATLRTTAVKDDDSYVLNGRKVFITNAHLANVFIILARTGEGSRGISAFVVDQSFSGIRSGRLEHKFGLHGCNTGEVILENCRVPEENLLGAEGQGLKIAFAAISKTGRTGTAGTALGILNACMEAASKQANERKLYGAPIANLQGIQWQIAEIFQDLLIAKLLCYHAAELLDKGIPCNAEIASAKYFTTEAAIRSSKRAIDIFGGYGYLMEYPVQRYYRDAECLVASSGTSDAMRIVIAKSALN